MSAIHQCSHSLSGKIVSVAKIDQQKFFLLSAITSSSANLVNEFTNDDVSSESSLLAKRVPRKRLGDSNEKALQVKRLKLSSESQMKKYARSSTSHDLSKAHCPFWQRISQNFKVQLFTPPIQQALLILKSHLLRIVINIFSTDTKQTKPVLLNQRKLLQNILKQTVE